MAVERRQLLLRKGALEQERSPWLSDWKDIARLVHPRGGHFAAYERNRPASQRHKPPLDNTAIRAAQVLAAGLMAGMTSPARPWFRLTTSTPELDEAPAVKRWLADVTRLMQMVFARSNAYRALHTAYEDLGSFGVASGLLMPNFDTVVHAYPLDVGSYSLATNPLGQVDTLYRETELTVAQMMREFGREACSQTVRNLFDRGNLEAPCRVVHVVEPRADRDVRLRDPKNMAWASIHFEPGNDGENVLRESGFKVFRALCPRWAVRGSDVYGLSPAMAALGDIKQLQHQQLRKGQAIDYQVRPPLQAPSGMSGGDFAPGGITYVDMVGPGNAVKTAFDVQLNLVHLREDIQDVRERIRSAFFVEMFLMLANGNNPQMTATEVAERHEEKLLMLGPTLERLHSEILSPLIEITFEQIVEANLLPPPPQELQGRALNVEFVSMLAQAQRSIATNSIDRFVLRLGEVAAIKPEALDRFDVDHWVDAYADALGLDPELVVPSSTAVFIRKQRAAAAQAQQQAAMVQQGADVAAKLGGINTAQPNALTDVARAFA